MSYPGDPVFHYSGNLTATYDVPVVGEHLITVIRAAVERVPRMFVLEVDQRSAHLGRRSKLGVGSAIMVLDFAELPGQTTRITAHTRPVTLIPVSDEDGVRSLLTQIRSELEAIARQPPDDKNRGAR